MSGHIVQGSDADRDEEIMNNVSVSSDKMVPVQLVQQIYKEITGKSERIGKSYDNNIMLEIDDILNMNHAFQHALEQYNVKESNCLISVFHADNTHDRYSSFERFSMHCRGSSASVETLHIKYNFLIILPKIQKVQTFTVSIMFLSRIAVEKRMSEDYYTAPPKAVAFMGRRTAFVEVEYVDYMVARNFVRVFDEWYGTIKKNKRNGFLRFMQNKSEKIPDIFVLFAIGMLFFAFMETTKGTLESNEQNLLIFGQLIGISAFIAFICIFVSRQIGSAVEYAIDSLTAISYIKITKGDEISISEALKQNRKSAFYAFFATIVSFMLSLSNKLAVTILVEKIIK